MGDRGGARYAVIFTAVAANLDAEYAETAQALRTLAFEKYGCLGFESSCEGGREIAVSYWADLDDIRAWKVDPVHQDAQTRGRAQWYAGYRIEVVELLRGYHWGAL